MQRLFEEILEKSGVIGVCILVKTKILFSESIPVNLSENFLSIIDSGLIDVKNAGVSADLSVKSASFYFDQYILLIIPLKDDVSLLIICETQVNCSAMAAVAAFIIGELSEEELSVASGKHKNEQVDEIVHGAVDSEEMRKLYEEIKVILAESVGPLYEDIMDVCMQQWKQSGAAVPSRIPELEKMLEREIWDKDLADEFVEKMRKIY